jgi:hypothetical protein
MDQAPYSTLGSLLRADKAKAKDCVETLRRDASRVKELIEEEMMNKYGCKWKVCRHRSLLTPDTTDANPRSTLDSMLSLACSTFSRSYPMAPD